MTRSERDADDRTIVRVCRSCLSAACWEGSNMCPWRKRRPFAEPLEMPARTLRNLKKGKA
jgi:hypothetical protein